MHEGVSRSQVEKAIPFAVYLIVKKNYNNEKKKKNPVFPKLAKLSKVSCGKTWIKAQKKQNNPMQIRVLDGERAGLTKRHSQSQIPVEGFSRVRLPLVARAEPSMSIQEENKRRM